ncbi:MULTISPECIES: AAA family ATPase [unclassified Tenacibaculum]|uniref:AAA family ATPase n=1 Tax=unclassified Tenacibaculum TaxID=2635139 RepID=UPI001F26EEAC|nr:MULTISPECIES: AAA family ATPase [unclassified Tenacibaculum]MCF2873819.1 AAA family ATPase [Tenacibaculum sp. Cn5-1]MCF2933975.1 AAA family ATPase [Tenacibaculum sp. Cn5-34]MCG7509443.1 AAA family ATPase [Tenacibaculum sp. Cn5-46]
MKISFVELQNFRKLKYSRIDFSNKETIFVGANNSGKTSAMDALILFLKEKTSFKTQDFTLSNWESIDKIGKSWLNRKEGEEIDYKNNDWNKLLPQLDIWLNIEENEIHYINHLIPTLDWDGGNLGVRLKLEPDNIETLHDDFCEAYNRSKNLKGKSKLKLWPSHMWEFLERRLHKYFTIKSYILDPSKVNHIDNTAPQELPEDSLPIDTNPFKGLIRIDIINAQRGFTDSNDNNTHSVTLSTQLKEYYSKHLDPSKEPNKKDIEALESIENAKEAFDRKLNESFTPSIKELETLNYPGFGNPTIKLSTKISTIDGLNHDSAVRFKPNEESELTLPEKYNGLGYQNLISMVFKLIRFRDSWMQTGKSLSGLSNIEKEDIYEPLHLVLIEEPEAHLHAQAQQVFIKKAYEVLRGHENLKNKKQFNTQLIVSTHSNHIAHEVEFTSLRYFKRSLNKDKKELPTSIVVNLTETFGKKDSTSKFSARYLKTTHCDLFFADAVILVEGTAERMLVPHFIKQHFPLLSSSYISILEIGGSHAHRLKPLIDKLGIITLIITDLDAVNDDKKAVLPELEKGYNTGNDTLKKWIPIESKLDNLIKLGEEKKVSNNLQVRVAYQTKIDLNTTNSNNKNIVYPYTFEDSLGFSNREYFKKYSGNGFIRKLNSEFNSDSNMKDIANTLFTYLKDNGKVKAPFALDLLFMEEPEQLKAPNYIQEGLKWVENQLKSRN